MTLSESSRRGLSLKFISKTMQSLLDYMARLAGEEA